jgi:hypothetical protein
MPTFENGWICRECWSANREQDQRCYRCHAVPKRREMPEPITFSTPDGKPNEERKKVSSLTGAPPAPSVSAAAAEPAAPTTPREFALMVRLRAIATAVGRNVGRVMRFLRTVRGAPRAAWQFATGKVHAGVDAVTSAVRSVLSHRRAWLTAAWLVSGFSSALLFSVALNATLAASLLVVGSVAIFSGLSAAITTNVSERRDRRAGDERARLVGHHEISASETVPSEHASQPAAILGSRPAR